MYKEWKEKAIQMRKEGYSYNLILAEAPVSKGTLSYWLSGIPFIPNEIVKQRVNNGFLKSSLKRHQELNSSIKKAREEAEDLVGGLSNRDLFMFGLGLYLGEGSKADQQTKIINSDPRVIRLTMLWLEKIFGLPKTHFRIMLHLYPDNDEKICISYWSNFTGIPKSQFQKSQIDRRVKKSKRKHRKLPYGTAHVRVKSNQKTEFGVYLFRRIMSSIDIVFENFGIIITER